MLVTALCPTPMVLRFVKYLSTLAVIPCVVPAVHWRVHQCYHGDKCLKRSREVRCGESIQDHGDHSAQQQCHLYTADSGLRYQLLMASCSVCLLAGRLWEMPSLVWPAQPRQQHSRGVLVGLVTPDLRGQCCGCLPPRAGLGLPWIPTLLLRACSVGAACKVHDVIQKCLPARTTDNITSHCCNGRSQLGLAGGGSIRQQELKDKMIKSSFSMGQWQCWHECLPWAQAPKSLPCGDMWTFPSLKSGDLGLNSGPPGTWSLWSRPDHASLMWKFTQIAAVVSFFTGNELNCFPSLGLARAVSKRWCK